MDIKKERQMQIQKEVVVQLTSDIWYRALFGFELFEYRVGEIEEFPEWFDFNVIFADLPPGKVREQAMKNFKEGDVEDAEMFLQLQIMALSRALKNKEVNILSEMKWLVKDFFKWYAGRSGMKFSKTDEYALSLLKTISGADFKEVKSFFPKDYSEEKRKISKEELNKVIESFSIAQHLIDKQEDKIKEELKEKKYVVKKRTHERGKVEDGKKRMLELLKELNKESEILWLRNKVFNMIIEDREIEKNIRFEGKKENEKVKEETPEKKTEFHLTGGKSNLIMHNSEFEKKFGKNVLEKNSAKKDNIDIEV